MNYSEFQFIEKIRSSQPSLATGIEGIGDDASIIPCGDDSIVITTDALVENVHFRLDWASAFQIGRKSAAVNLSDVAAMGAEPFGLFLSLSLPESIDSSWAEEFISGVNSYGIPLLGGDTTSSPCHLFINITAIGKAPKENIKRRSTACSGDELFVTGHLGDSGAGLYILQNGIQGYDSLVEAHLNPSAQLRKGLLLGGNAGVTSMMDISDGLAGDVRHIMEQSNLSARIDCSKIPVSETLQSFCRDYGLDPLKFALESGEDYQLLFSMKQKNYLPLHSIKIGMLYSGSQELVFENSQSAQYHGYTHF